MSGGGAGAAGVADRERGDRAAGSSNAATAAAATDGDAQGGGEPAGKSGGPGSRGSAWSGLGDRVRRRRCTGVRAAAWVAAPVASAPEVSRRCRRVRIGISKGFFFKFSFLLAAEFEIVWDTSKVHARGPRRQPIPPVHGRWHEWSGSRCIFPARPAAAGPAVVSCRMWCLRYTVIVCCVCVRVCVCTVGLALGFTVGSNVGLAVVVCSCVCRGVQIPHPPARPRVSAPAIPASVPARFPSQLRPSGAGPSCRQCATLGRW